MCNNNKKLCIIILLNLLAGAVLLWHFSMAVKYDRTEILNMGGIDSMDFRIKDPIIAIIAMGGSLKALFASNFKKDGKRKFEQNEENFARDTFLGACVASLLIALDTLSSFEYFQEILLADISHTDQILFISTCIVPFILTVVLSIVSGVKAYKLHKGIDGKKDI